ncbi:hypothetical protein EYC80_000835 [Monilinia laxa]|uniref:BZIP domain-containing protein n=1 Tax=Monilinia laxa TaxID=61186 RepID=A0A5N6K7C9_MONLA|nr:hypothetical protein EYC80_000835 [Monilinia laxa]
MLAISPGDIYSIFWLYFPHFNSSVDMTSASDDKKATNVVMTNTKFNNLDPGHLNFGEFLTDNELKTIQSTSYINNPSPNFYFSPGPRVEKEAPDWNPAINVNHQAFATDLSDDTFLRMFDDIIRTPSPITYDKQHETVGSSPNIKTKDIRSSAAMGSLKTENNSIKLMSKRQQDNSLAAFQIETRPAALQSNEISKVPSIDKPFTMENASKRTNVDMNNGPGKRTSNGNNTNTKTSKNKKHTSPTKTSSTSTSNSNTAPPAKRKRRPRAKKILTPTESLQARKKYLEKNRRAARKCRMKKKAEMASDQARYDFYANEIRATKVQLGACRTELLGLIEMCKRMVGEGCAGEGVRRFVGNLAVREEACRGMLESGDLGVECWKLVERCRGARLGEGVLGDVGCEVGGTTEGGNVNENEDGNWAMGYCEMKNEIQEQFQLQDDTNLSYNSSALTENEEGAAYGPCQTSVFTLQPQQPQQPQPPTTSWHNTTTALQNVAPTPDPTNTTLFSPSIFTHPTNRLSFSSPLTINQQKPQQHVKTPSQTTKIEKQKQQKHHQTKSKTKIVPHMRHESIDSGYGSICSSNSITNSTFSPDPNLFPNSNSNSNSNPNSNYWSPDLAIYEEYEDANLRSLICNSTIATQDQGQTQIQTHTQTHAPSQEKLSVSACRDFVYENVAGGDVVNGFVNPGAVHARVADSENCEMGGREAQAEKEEVEGLLGSSPVMEMDMEVDRGPSGLEFGYSRIADNRAMCVDSSVVIVS